jgi:hypothetical protein
MPASEMAKGVAVRAASPAVAAVGPMAGSRGVAARRSVANAVVRATVPDITAELHDARD